MRCRVASTAYAGCPGILMYFVLPLWLAAGLPTISATGVQLRSRESPKLIRLGIAAVPDLQLRANGRPAVANVEAEAIDADQFGKVALRLDLPGLIGFALAGSELD